jgi:microsomal epoxide hydrolase
MITPEPFTIDVPAATIQWILERVRLYEWPEAPEDGGWAYDTNLDYMKELAAYWVSGYDWRAEEAKLNGLSHFTAGAEGTTIHFIRERGSGTDPMPLMLIHG